MSARIRRFLIFFWLMMVYSPVPSGNGEKKFIRRRK